METQSRLHLGGGHCVSRRLPTLVGIRPLRHQLPTSSSLDYLESPKIQSTSSWSSRRFMELYLFQHLSFGPRASCDSPRCRGQHHPSQMISRSRSRSVGSCPVVYAIAINYVSMNYCLSPFCVSGPVGRESVPGIPGLGVVWGFQSGFYIFLAAVLVLVAGLLFNSRLSGRLVTTGDDDAPVHKKCGSVVPEVWVKPAVSVKVLFQLRPGPKPLLAPQYFLTPPAASMLLRIV